MLKDHWHVNSPKEVIASVTDKHRVLIGNPAGVLSMLFDTGTESIWVDEETAKKFYGTIGAKKKPGESRYKVGCEEKFSFDFRLGETDYSVPSEYLLKRRRFGETDCAVSVSYKTGGTYWTIGEPFFNNRTVIFDKENSRVGVMNRAP